VTADARVDPVPQRLAIVLPGIGQHDSRTVRIARTMTDRGHEVTILARSGQGHPPGDTIEDGAHVIRVRVGSPRRLPMPARVIDRALAVERQARAALRADPGAALYHGMAFLGLPVALRLGAEAGAPVVYDARDIYGEARTVARLPSLARSLFTARERSWARRAAAVVTVNDLLADRLADRLGIPRPTVVMNCPPRWDPAGAWPRRFHEALGLEPGNRIVLYHGGLEPDRGIEELLAAVPLLEPDLHVVLLGYGRLRASLQSRIDGDPTLRERVHLVDAVPPRELAGWVASADVAVAAIQPTSANHRLSTPNKLFEALGAGVPVVASDFPAMRRIVADDPAGPLGLVCDPTDPSAIAAAVGLVLGVDAGAYAALRSRCLAAAHERYAWETQVEQLLGLYSRLTGRPW